MEILEAIHFSLRNLRNQQTSLSCWLYRQFQVWEKKKLLPYYSAFLVSLINSNFPDFYQFPVWGSPMVFKYSDYYFAYTVDLKELSQASKQVSHWPSTVSNIRLRSVTIRWQYLTRHWIHTCIWTCIFIMTCIQAFFQKYHLFQNPETLRLFKKLNM